MDPYFTGTIKMKLQLLILSLMIITTCMGYKDWIEYPGPRVKATQGEVWPKPQKQISTNDVMVVRPSVFLFVVRNTLR